MKEKVSYTDEALVVAICDNNKELFAEIIGRYEAKLLRYANYLLWDDSLAKDAVQETFIKAYINLRGFNTSKKFSSWIYRIAHNECMNLLRKHKITKSLDAVDSLDTGVSLEDTVIKEELIKSTHACLASLPIIYAEPLSLFYLEDRSYEEISEILRIPTGTVGTRINRAKGLMKKICQK